MADRPIIRIVSGPSPTQKGMHNAAADGFALAVSSISAAADLLPFDSEALFGVLHFRLHSAGQARKRRIWFGGRMFNRFSGQSADYILLSGAHLRQVFSAAGIEAPEFIVARGQYELRVDYAQRAYDALKGQAGAAAK
ncbi:hypothetical protein [uncultured Ruegeria sp.]|uniref:hypothetical protein n=1 Tax=uncultured Ruegeria sp. TaxID=259304 RepID=UPI0026303CA1|nr:hypothetical protein [uncultured Ruegeria sp.]